MTNSFDRLHEKALAWHQTGKGAALATVIQTWGSAPRPVGSQLAISGDSDMLGSVSGGCVEGAVVAEALDALADGRSRILEYGVSDDDAFAVGLACGGTIRVIVEPVGGQEGPSVDLLRQVIDAEAMRTPIAIETDLTSWERRVLDRTSLGPNTGSGFDDAAGGTFRWVSDPPLRLAIIGAVHISQALCAMASSAGYDVTVIDPRAAFASEARFPGVALSNDWPDEALKAHGLDRRTAIVTLTHDPKLDDPALIEALRSEVFYIGALGSRRTHAKRAERLKAEGFTQSDIDRINAPIGLDIGAKSPAEIAISALAEMTERLRRPETRPGKVAPEGQVA